MRSATRSPTRPAAAPTEPHPADPVVTDDPDIGFTRRPAAPGEVIGRAHPTGSGRSFAAGLPARTLVSAILGLVALAGAATLSLDRSAVDNSAPEIAGSTVTLDQRLVELATELRASEAMSVPIVDSALTTAASELTPDTSAAPVVPGWTVIATAVVVGNDLDALWESLRTSPDHRIVLQAPGIRGWGVHVTELDDGTLRAAMIAAR